MKMGLNRHIGSVVLGLNDAIIELTGALAGFTFAFQNSRVIGVAGAITGVAAALSMAASEYLSISEEGRPDPVVASLYTGVAYLITVCLLILPYLFIQNSFAALKATLALALLIIFVFNLYVSKANKKPFKRRFLKMLFLSLGIALVNFLIGTLIRKYLHADL